MSAHPNARVLESLYADFAKADLGSFLSQCADNITFQVPGKSPLAGKYTKDTFGPGYVTQLRERSGNTLKFEAHDILASDRHATVLGTISLTRKGEAAQIRTVHVWRFEGGKPVAWYEYPRDLYQYDAIWS